MPDSSEPTDFETEPRFDRREVLLSVGGGAFAAGSILPLVRPNDIAPRRSRAEALDPIEQRTPHRTRTLMITGNRPTEYTLAVDGTLEPDRFGGDFRGDEDDTPIETDDGLLVASDDTGPKLQNSSPTAFLGDRFLFRGSVEQLDIDSHGDVNLYLDEENVSRHQLLGFQDSFGTHTLMITGNRPTDYALAVDGTLEPDRFGGDFTSDDDDTPRETDDGLLITSDDTGPKLRNASPTAFLGDRFVLTGSVEQLDIDSHGDVNLYLDERSVSIDEVFRRT